MLKNSLAFIITIISIFFVAETYAQTGEKNYTVHEVNSGETLYSISKKYNVTIADIFKSNPVMPADSIIKEGMLLKIPKFSSVPAIAETVETAVNVPFNPYPFSNKKPVAVAETKPVVMAEQKPVTKPAIDAPVKPTKAVAAADKPPVKTPEPVVVPKVEVKEKGVVVHEVSEGQTLYAIARKYGVAVEEIREWNNLADYSVQMGAQLVIYPDGKPEPEPEPVAAETKPAPKPLPAPVKAEIPVNTLQDMLYQHYLDAKARKGNPSVDKVTISWLKSDAGKSTSNYFALHKTAPNGTIIKITNLVTKKYVFVKVIGKLPETADNKSVTMRVSMSAKKELQLNDDKAYVETTYFP